MRSLIVCLLVLLCKCGFSESHSSPTPRVVRDLAPYTLSSLVRECLYDSDEEFNAYHWVQRKEIGTKKYGFGVNETGKLDENDPKLKDHVQDWSSYYFESLKNGLYLGTDPVYYRSFGGENFLLYRLKLPKGIRYLDVYGKCNGKKFPKEIIEQLASRGCKVEASDEIEEMFRGEGFGAKQTPECAQIVFNTMKELKVDAIRYEKGASNFTGCEKVRERFAIFMVNASKIPRENIAYFYKEMNDPALRSEQIQIEKMFLDEKPVEGRSTFEKRPFPELDEQARKAPPILLKSDIRGCH